MHRNFDPTRVRTDDHQDHDSTFYITEPPALTTWPSVTSYVMLKSIQAEQQEILLAN